MAAVSSSSTAAAAPWTAFPAAATGFTALANAPAPVPAPAPSLRSHAADPCHRPAVLVSVPARIPPQITTRAACAAAVDQHITAVCARAPWPALIDHLATAAVSAIVCDPHLARPHAPAAAAAAAAAAASPPPPRRAARAAPPTLAPPTPPLDPSPTPHPPPQSAIRPVAHVARRLARAAHATAGDILAACILLRRARARIPSTARGMATTHHRLVVAAVVVARKVMHDTPWKNKAWSAVVGLPVREVNLMERQLLALLEFDVVVRGEDVVREVAEVGVGMVGVAMEEVGVERRVPVPGAAVNKGNVAGTELEEGRGDEGIPLSPPASSPDVSPVSVASTPSYSDAEVGGGSWME
ncbi:hypothetical protein GGF31_004849 [Allomyces arbusculus]|nr:hypothetical protein GGF31_004849 [Allomyces arbusculus]